MSTHRALHEPRRAVERKYTIQQQWKHKHKNKENSISARGGSRHLVIVSTFRPRSPSRVEVGDY